MNSFYFLRCKVLLILLFSYLPIQSFAQVTNTSLIVTEVYLDSITTSNCWIEIYNPTDKALTLQRFRISHIRTINVLPQSTQNQGGIEVPAKSCIVLCADKGQMEKTYGVNAIFIEVPAIKKIGGGGFLGILTKNRPETQNGIVRYGDPARSSYVREFATKEVLNFSKYGKSKARIATKKASSMTLSSSFLETTPTPGRIND